MKLGIVGSGNIVNEFLKVAGRVPDLDVCALLARKGSKRRATKLAAQYNVPRVDMDAAAFFKNPDIDTVYVAVPNHLHYAFAKKALEAGKHVIVEKPFVKSAEQARELYQLADKKDRFLFEAVPPIHTEGYKKMKENIDSLGDIRIVEANYSQISSRYDDFKNGLIRPVFDVRKGGGALADLNIYNLHLTVGLFGKPRRVHYFANTQCRVDTSGVAVLQYPGFIATLTAAKDSFTDSYFNVQGENGLLLHRTPANTCGPFEIEYADQEIAYFDGAEYHTNRLEQEFGEFTRIVRENDMYTYEKLRKHTLDVQEVFEKLRESTAPPV